MDRTEIVEALAKEQRVEAMIQNIAHQTMSADLKDLAQEVYFILLTYDEEKLRDLWENNQMNFFLARIIVNQYRSNNSPYYKTFRKFRMMVDEEIQFMDTDEWDKKYWDIIDIISDEEV